MQYAAVLLQPAVYISHVEAHRVLPHKPADATSYACGLVEQAFLWLDGQAFFIGAPYLTVFGRIAEDTPLYQIPQKLLVFTLVFLVKYVKELVICGILTGIWKVALQVPGDAPGIAGEAARLVVDVFHYLVYCCIEPLSYAVVEGSVGKPAFDMRTHVLGYVVVADALSHIAREDFPRFWTGSHKGVGSRLQGTVVHIQRKTQQVSLPVELKLHAVR